MCDFNKCDEARDVLLLLLMVLLMLWHLRCMKHTHERAAAMQECTLSQFGSTSKAQHASRTDKSYRSSFFHAENMQ
jgi:hypothetical protein